MLHWAAAYEVINPRMAGFPSLDVASNVIAMGLLSQKPLAVLLAMSPDNPAFRQNAVAYVATNLVKCDGGMF